MDQVDSNTPIQQEVVPESETPTVVVKQGASGGLVAFLTILILALLSFVAYMFFTDKLDIGIDNPLSSHENISEEKTPEDENEASVVKTGQFHLTMTYPSEFVPAHRVCFTDTTDISKMFCFIGSGTEDNSKDYENLLSDGTGNLPVGKYNMEYKLLNDVDYYVWNPCVKTLNGEEVTDDSVCEAFYDKIEQFYTDADWLNFKVSYINSYGGEPIEIEIKENEITEIGNVASQPYISFDFMSE